MWDTGKVHSIEEHEYVFRKYHKDVSVAHEKVAVPVVSGSFSLVDAEAAYRFCRRSLESAAPFLQSSST